MATLRKMTEFGATLKGNIAYKEIEGYQFNFVENQIANQHIFMIPLEASQQNIIALKNDLKTTSKHLKLNVTQSNTSMVTFLWQGNLKGLNLQTLKDYTEGLVAVLHKLSIQPHTACPFCEQGEPDTIVTINGITVKGHEACKQNAIQDIANAPVEVKKNPFAKSLVGALLGAAIGAIPWILVDLFVGFFAAILGVLIGYSAFYFYKKFGGVVVNYTKYVIIGVTLLGVLFANFVIATYVILNNDGAIVLSNYVVVYSDPEIGPILFQSLGIGLVISLFSLPTIFKKVQQEEDTKTVIE